jgi:hypothetical protein
MKILIICLFLLTFSFAGMTAEPVEKITTIDRDALFKNFKFPNYVVPTNELKKMTYEESVKALKEDIYKYVKEVEAHYMVEVKSPVSLLDPTATQEKIDKAVNDMYHNFDQLSNIEFSNIVTEAVKSYFVVVQGQNNHPTITTINDLYEETLRLKMRVRTLEGVSISKTSTPLVENIMIDENTMMIYAALLLSGLSLVISVFKGRSGKRKAKFANYFFPFLLLISAFIVIEVVFSLFIKINGLQSYFDLDKIIKSYQHSWYGPNFNHVNCHLDSSLIPHPYLGFVSTYDPDCKIPITDLGTHGSRNLLDKKDSDEFSIVVLGGSQASHLASVGPESYLEKILNEKYKFPSKTHFKIYNGAHPGWKMPVPYILKLILYKKFDAIIVLDGFNEFLDLVTAHDPWQASAYLYTLSLPKGLSTYDLVTRTRRILAKTISQFPFLMHSSAISFVLIKLIQLEYQKYSQTHINSPTLDQVFLNYKTYIFNMIENNNTIKTSHFFQPSALYGKTLTQSEMLKCVICNSDVLKKFSLYRELYINEIQRKLKYSHDLTMIFAKQKNDIYMDTVHFRLENNGPIIGYKLMANEMATMLASDWKLEKK